MFSPCFRSPFATLSTWSACSCCSGYMSRPVFYSVQSVPVDWRRWFNLNPLVHIFEAYRVVLIQGRYPEMLPLLWIAAISIAVLAATYRAFVRSSHWFIEEIGS